MTYQKTIPIECCTVDNTIVVRIEGRATFKQAAPLKEYFDRILQADERRDVIVDLARCDTLDSTFLGILAGMSSSMKKKGWGPLHIVNLNATIQRLVKIIGLDHVVEIYPERSAPETEGETCEPIDDDQPIGKKEQILLMLNAHQQLMPLDEGNPMRFKNLMTCLQDSLDKEQEKEPD